MSSGRIIAFFVLTVACGSLRPGRAAADPRETLDELLRESGMAETRDCAEGEARPCVSKDKDGKPVFKNLPRGQGFGPAGEREEVSAAELETYLRDVRREQRRAHERLIGRERRNAGKRFETRLSNLRGDAISPAAVDVKKDPIATRTDPSLVRIAIDRVTIRNRENIPVERLKGNDLTKDPIYASMIDKDQLHRIFAHLDSLPKHSPGKAADINCQERSRQALAVLQSLGYNGAQIEVDSDWPGTLKSENWNGHVAPVVFVKGRHGPEIRVLDTYLFKTPVPLSTWLDEVVRVPAGLTIAFSHKGRQL